MSLKTAELSARTQVSVATLYTWAALGLLHLEGREATGRIYPDQAVERVEFV
ncbi:MerR family transcriptional regulator, partial [Deinococcus sp. HMF7604]|uniref:MerR family transcriptional regulator n=1 Tax=Deinococcus betulae TaxID=2873312 RepID=UPI001CCF4E18|nr:MerR family transcriptional regulator [Deinococcus betulae]